MQNLWPMVVGWSGGLFGLLVLAFVVRRVLRRLERRATERRAIERCTCGYPLAGLALARCPECGRVIGFNATAEELGLSDEELRRASEARERRKVEEKNGG
jgi:flagellar biosynthesis/type III secretory pathway M-ring protein FliF/YscJ